uniref:Uncharacterized protein n=1 Tax=Anopheles coluzzii TaxID=1518534 RepID=A0A8W7P9Q6_ANOCL
MGRPTTSSTIRYGITNAPPPLRNAVDGNFHTLPSPTESAMQDIRNSTPLSHFSRSAAGGFSSFSSCADGDVGFAPFCAGRPPSSDVTKPGLSVPDILKVGKAEDKNEQRGGRCNQSPADAPVERCLDAQHKPDVATDPIHAVNPRNGSELQHGKRERHSSPKKYPTVTVPRTTCQWRSWGRWSRIAVMMLVVTPRLLPTPTMNSIRKNRAANSCGKNWNLAIASGYVMKVRPAPSRASFWMSGCPLTYAKLPITPNTMQPATIEVNVSSQEIMTASLCHNKTNGIKGSIDCGPNYHDPTYRCTLLLKLLKDEYAMMPP